MKKLELFGIVATLLFLALCGGCDGTVTDTIPPTASSTSPANGATDVAIGAVITATFSEAMDASTITNSTFTLSTNPPVSGTVSYNSGTNTATFTPSADLDYITTYTATITTGAEDLAGNALGADYVWNFTTGAEGGDEGSAVQLPETGQTTSYATGDDGDLQRGVSWPTPRFTDNGDGTVTDELTGLMWLKDADCFGVRTWTQALSDANNLASGSCGLSDGSDAGDWYLPNVNELESPVNAEESNSATWLNGQGFTDVQAINYWSATTYADDTGGAWNVDMWDGRAFANNKSGSLYVWPVRAPTTPPAQLWETGQTTSYETGDDGDLQRGVSWPTPRFTDNGDGTITDELTELMWTQDANAPGPAGCANAVTMIWQDALDYVACLSTNNYLGYNDWRLPNKKELHSLTDFSQSDPALQSPNPFTNVQATWYWSSTNCAPCTGLAWIVSMFSGRVGTGSITSDTYVWPVRAGQ
jgi:hypothetical protein